jgi:hypothetical protein
MQKLVLAFCLSAASLTALAQSAPAFTSSCDEQKMLNGDKHSYCETRDLTVAVPASGALLVDAQRNGGITVRSWTGTEVRVRAQVQAWHADDATAKANLASIKINTSNNKLMAEGSGSENDWSVSYELLVPEALALTLKTHNGGIRLDGVKGAVTFNSQNGGVSIVGNGGNVRGRTQNGGLNITLNGKSWEGKGIDVTTQNGGISWKIPADYSAKLYSSTARGRISSDFISGNSKAQGDTEVAMALGKGGAQVKAVTSNGSISIRQQE